MLRLLPRLLIICTLSSCTGNNLSSVTPPAEITVLSSQLLGLHYEIIPSQNNESRLIGNPYTDVVNNCGSQGSTIGTFRRERTFTATVTMDISQEIQDAFPGQVAQIKSEIEAKILQHYGLQIGTSETITAQREVPAPPNTKQYVTLQVEEIWGTGHISATYPNGSVISVVPFRVLTALNLKQMNIDEVHCDSDEPQQEPTITPMPTVMETHTPLAITPLVERPAEIATNTPIPGPTATAVPRPPATATTLPPPTSSSNSGNGYNPAIPAPVLLVPSSGTEHVHSRITFQWRWSGTLQPGWGFEIRGWLQGNPHNGVHDARETANIQPDGNGVYSLDIKIPTEFSYAQWFWTVAVVRLDPYERIGPEADAFTLKVDTRTPTPMPTTSAP